MCEPTTSKPPAGSSCTTPAEVVPSPQAIVAEKSEATAPGAADQAFERLATDLAALCGTIRNRSGATVLLTDYLTVIPADPAVATPPLPPGTAAWGRGVTARLTAVIGEVAAEQHCLFVSLSQASAAHHAWSADPWTRGFHLTLHGGAAYHPTLAGMAAAADLVAASVRARAPELAA